MLVNIINKIKKESFKSERFERKIPLSAAKSFFYANDIINNGFISSYNSRIVNTVYFDTNDLTFAQQNINGEEIRIKPRLRFYNDDFKNIQIEYKIKYGYLGYKFIDFSHQIKVDKDINNSINDFSLYLGNFLGVNLKPISLVRYKRHYFEYNNIRATIDDDLQYRLFSHLDFFQSMSFQNVLEFKYKRNYDDFFRNELDNYFSLSVRSNKFSKYIQSIKNFY